MLNRIIFAFALFLVGTVAVAQNGIVNPQTNASALTSGTLATGRYLAPTTATPAVTCGSGSGFTITSVAEYTQFNKTINLSGTITVTTLGTCASSLVVTLPVTASATYAAGASGVNLSTGKPIAGGINPIGPNTVTLVASDATGVPASGNGQTVAFSVTYFAP